MKEEPFSGFSGIISMTSFVALGFFAHDPLATNDESSYLIPAIIILATWVGVGTLCFRNSERTTLAGACTIVASLSAVLGIWWFAVIFFVAGLFVGYVAPQKTI